MGASRTTLPGPSASFWNAPPPALPYEIYELTEKPTWLRVAALVINLLLVIYLAWTKRLFGIRGGKEACDARLRTESVIEVEQAALSAASPGPGGEQSLLLVACRGGDLEILPVDRGFLLAAHLRDLLVQLPARDGHRLVVSGLAAHTRFVFRRVRNWFNGAGWFVGLAVALFTFALLALLIGLQSPDSVLWTGQQVTGTEQQGLVYYRWHGQSYTLDVSGYGSSKAVSVYLDPGDPSHAMIDNVADRVAAILLIGLPTAGGVALLAVGGTRNYRWARRNAKRAREDPRERARGQW